MFAGRWPGGEKGRGRLRAGALGEGARRREWIAGERRQRSPVWRDPSGDRCGCDCDGGDVAVDFEGAVSAESSRFVMKAGRVTGARWNGGVVW